MAEFFTRPNFEDRQIIQRTGDSIKLSGTTTVANPGYLQINKGAAPGLVATSLDFDGTVIWGPISGVSWSISACTSPLYVNNLVACPSSAGTIVIQSGVLSVNGALQLNPTLSGGTAGDRLLVIDSNGYVKVGQTGTSITSLNYNNNTITLTLNDGSIFTATINVMTGLTVNGNLIVTGNTSVGGSVSATTYYGDGSNLTNIPDFYVTGGTFNSGTGTLTLNRQNGSFDVTGFTTGGGGTGFTDNYVTGGTFVYSTGDLILDRQNGSVTIPGLRFTGNTAATCITDLYIENLYGCSNLITVWDSVTSVGSTSNGTLSFAFGNNVTASGNYSMAQGNATSTVGGTYAHAEGFNTLASGQGSHAEGRGSIASGNYSHAQGLFTNATAEGTFASGSGSTASGANSFVHSVGSTVSGARSVVLGGFGINGSTNDFVYVPSLNINTLPVSSSTPTQILIRNASNGNVEYTNISSIVTDTFVTGYTFTNNNTLTITRNQGQPPLPVTINNLTLTGLTVNGSVSATTYYGDGSNLTNLNPTDTFVTGFTFTSGNTLTIRRNQGLPDLPVRIDSLTLTGLTLNGVTYTGFTDTFVTGGTYSNGTLTLSRQNGVVTITGFTNTDTFVTGFTFTSGNTLTIFQNQGKTPLPVTINNLTLTGLTLNGVTYTGFTDNFVTGGTFSSGTLTLNRQNGIVTITGFTSLDNFVTGGTYSNGTLTLSRQNGIVTVTGFTNTDTFVTGFTFTSGNTLTISRNQGLPDLPVTINNLTLTGLTLNGVTYTGFTDTFVTGGTFLNGTLTLSRQNGVVTVTGFTSTDTFVTGYTFTNNNTLTIGRNQGLPPLPVTINNLFLTGLTVAGAVSATTYLNLPPFITGFTDTFVTGFTFTNNNTLTIGRNQGQPPLPVTINNLTLTGLTVAGAISASTYLNLPAFITGFTDTFVTGGTFSSGTLTLNRQNGVVTVTGFTDTFVTGYTFTNNNTLTISRNQGLPPLPVTINNLFLTGLTVAGAVSATTYLNLPPFITGFTDTFVTGGTYSNGTLTLSRQNGVVTVTGFTNTDTFVTGYTFTNNNTLTITRNQGLPPLPVTINNLTLTGLTVAGAISASTYLNLPGFITGATDTFVTGFTFTNNNTLTIGRNQGLPPLPVTINNLTLTGLTINGSISASTYLNLPPFITGFTDTFVTGGTFLNNTLTLNRQNGVVTITGFTDTFVTGYTFTNNNTLTIGRNQGLPPLPVTINNLTLTGLTIAGAISASTYLNLPGFITGFTDNFVTGGTFSSGTLILSRQNGVVTVTGFTDTFVTGYTFTNNNTLTIGRNQGLPPLPVTINNLTLTGLTVAGAISASTYLNLPGFITGFTDTFVTGGTFSNNTLTLNRQNGVVTVTGFTDTFVTGYTFTNNNTLTIGRNQGLPDLPVTINNLFLTGLTVAGAISATTYLNLPPFITGFTDNFVTGGTFSAGTLTLRRQNGSFDITGFTSTDTFVTGFTFTSGNTLTITRNQGLPSLPVTINDITLTGLTLNGVTYTSLNPTVPGPPVTSVQFNGGNNIFSGSSNFTFDSTTNRVSIVGTLAVSGKSVTVRNNVNSSTFIDLANYNQGANAYVLQAYQVGSGSSIIDSGNFLFGINYTGNTYLKNSNLLSTISTTDIAKQINFIASPASNSTFEWHYNTSNQINGVGVTQKMILSGSTGDLWNSGSHSTTALTLRNTPTLNNSATEVLVRNSTTGVVERRSVNTIGGSGSTGIETITLVTTAPNIPIVGVGEPSDSVKSIPQDGQNITGYTNIYVNNALQVGPTVTTNFGTFNNTTGIFTPTVSATYLINAYIHLKPDTNTTTAWSLSGTGEFGLGICRTNNTDIFVGDYQTIIPDPDKAQYVYELYGANAPRTNQIDLTTGTVLYIDATNTNNKFILKVLNKTDRNYVAVAGDAIRFSITKLL